MNSRLLIPIIAFFFSVNLYSQDEFPRLLDSLYYSNFAIGNDPLKGFLKVLKDQNKLENRFTAKFKFGVSSNNSRNSDLTQYNISANITRGFFPGELNFNSELNVQFQDGAFVENFSKLSASYDHHIGNDMDWEGFIFLQRSTNNFLNIDQRYEISTGVVYNIFNSSKNAHTRRERLKKSKGGITQDGGKKLRALLAYKLPNPKKDEKDSLDISNQKEFTDVAVNALNEELKREELKRIEEENDELDEDQIKSLIEKKVIKLNNRIDKKTKKDLTKTLKNVVNSIEKQEFKARFSLLAGISYESERTADSLQLFFTDEDNIQRSFEPINLFRAVVAPRLQLKLDDFEFSSRFFIKLAISGDDLRNEVELDDNDDDRLDYRAEWVNSASVKISDNISIVGSFNFVHINAPRRIFENNNLYVAANRFSNFNITFQYSLK